MRKKSCPRLRESNSTRLTQPSATLLAISVVTNPVRDALESMPFANENAQFCGGSRFPSHPRSSQLWVDFEICVLGLVHFVLANFASASSGQIVIIHVQTIAKSGTTLSKLTYECGGNVNPFLPFFLSSLKIWSHYSSFLRDGVSGTHFLTIK